MPKPASNPERRDTPSKWINSIRAAKLNRAIKIRNIGPPKYRENRTMGMPTRAVKILASIIIASPLYPAKPAIALLKLLYYSVQVVFIEIRP